MPLLHVQQTCGAKIPQSGQLSTIALLIISSHGQFHLLKPLIQPPSPCNCPQTDTGRTASVLHALPHIPQCPVARPCRLEPSPQPVASAADLPPSVLRSAAGLLLLILHTFLHPLFLFFLSGSSPSRFRAVHLPRHTNHRHRPRPTDVVCGFP